MTNLRAFILCKTAAALAVAASGCVGVSSEPSDPIDEPSDTPSSCDADADGFFRADTRCDTERNGAVADCDDDRADVHPGAAPVCGDGAINSCTDFGDLDSVLGVEEIGLIAEQALVRTDPDGFYNNVGIVAEGGSPARVLVVAAESAQRARVVHARMGEPTSAVSIPVSFPADYHFANHNVDVSRMSEDSYIIGTQARGPGNSYVPAMAQFSLEGTEAIALGTIALPSNCPTNLAVGGQPHVRHGMDDSGQLYFDLQTNGDPPELYAVAARINGDAQCRLLTAAGGDAEFGSQLIATGHMAIGRGFNNLWTWDLPINYDDLHAYAPSEFVAGVHAALARDTPSGEPVLLAYRGSDQLVIEALQCTGLAACSRITTTPQTTDYVRDLAFAPLATGAVLVQLRGEASDPRDMVIQLVDTNGALLAGGATIPLGALELEYRALDATTVPPSVGRDYYDVFVAYAVRDQLAQQEEIRVRQVRACQAR
jgi:hypothetical protein